MKYAFGDASGNIVAFYDDVVHAQDQIPEGGVPITDEQWADCLANPGKWLVENEALVASPAWPPPPVVVTPAPDVAGFLKAIPLDANVPQADLSAIVGDPRATMMIWALQVGDFAHAQTYYNGLKDAPPTGATAADVESLGALFAPHGIPITA